MKQTLLNNPGIKEEISGEMRKYFELNENEDTTYPNQCDAVKAVLKGK